MKRIYGLHYYDIGVGDYSQVFYESVEEAYKSVHKLGFTERLGFYITDMKLESLKL